MATEGHIDQFSAQLKAWSELELKKVYREDLGTVSLINLKTLIEDLTNKIKRTDTVKDKLGDSLLSSVYNIYRQITAYLNQLVGYNNEQFVSNKTTLENQIKNQYQQLLNHWPQVVAIINDTSETADATELLKELDELSKKSEQDAKEIEDLKTRLTSELSDFEKRYREQFQRAELVNQREIFSIQSNKYNSTAKYWLYGIIGSTIFLIIMLWVVFRNFCFDISCYQSISEIDYSKIDPGGNGMILYLEIFKSVAYRIFLISFIVYAVSFCVRNYNANKHNFTVNAQKANSLNAALVLLERAKTDDGNDNIMIQAASAIFSHQPTGYNKKDPENIGNSITEKIIEKVNPIKD
ncbi:hypothetical protein [Allomuricauda sp. SCSIO 65647]|uniref:hypothetical protein n=1 Tax=Allomuricauda sp. SCSIO 65647 TaxID=2908843 RepID=UPI001F3B8AE7|nr:hypothetical protein [Muricauda sp. SCSIO 65647]UJH69075.1 hypothetical protein L0P89_07635 [Muricauda sp. SCSIO 65647]